MSEEIKEETINKHLGLVCYTDGGARPNPGYGGKGIHAYLYDLNVPFKTVPSGCSMVPTTHGYVPQGQAVQGTSNPEEALRKVYENVPQVVSVKEYIEFTESPVGIISNNVCEVDALCTALRMALDKKVSMIHILTDSENTMDGANDWMYTWRNNGWTKRDGREVANLQYWVELMNLRETLEANGVLVRITKVKAHDGEIGNEAADTLATIGVFQARNSLGTRRLESTFTFGPNELWKHTVNKHPFLNNKYLYFNTMAGSRTPGKYYMGNHGKNDELMGKNMSDASIAVVTLKEPNKTVETIRETQARYSENADSLYIVYLDNAFAQEANRGLNIYGELSLQPPSGYRQDLLYMGVTPITSERKPAGLAWRVVDELTWLNTQLEKFVSKDPSVVVTNITDTIYDVTQKVTKGKKGTPDIIEPSTKLKAELAVGCTHLEMEVNYKVGQTEGSTNLRLTTGIDILDRNALKRLEGRKTQVYVITWDVGDNAFRYATIIESDDSIGIWAGPYSNFRLLG